MGATRDSDSIGASYDHCLRSTKLSSYSGSQSARTTSGGMPGCSVDDPHTVGILGVDPAQTMKDRTLGFGGLRPEPPLPLDASSTLFVLTDIFRLFVGHKEVKLVSKGPGHPEGDPLVVYFVDFISPTPADAATAMNALQGHASLYREYVPDEYMVVRILRK